jgi:hypothetical protein
MPARMLEDGTRSGAGNGHLGKLNGTFRVKLGFGYLGPFTVLLAVAAIGFVLFWGSEGIYRYVSFLVFALLASPLLYAAWRTIPTLRDELRIYDGGFIYESRRGQQSCSWDEIGDHTSIVDFGKRLKMTSATKNNGEKITFAYRMRGLDVLEYEYQNWLMPEESELPGEVIPVEPQTLGVKIGSHRIKKSLSLYLPAIAVFFLFLFGLLTFVASEDIFSLAVCALPPLVLFCVLARTLFTDRNDELTVFENGFTYKDKKETVSCLWDEIEDYRTTTRGNLLTGIKKENGPWIEFAHEMQGLESLQPHLRTVLKWTGPEE